MNLDGAMGVAGGDEEREGGAFSRGGSEFDACAEHVGEFAGDGEAEAGAGVLACDGAVDLAEFFEDDALVVEGDSGPGVGDVDANLGDVRCGGIGVGGERFGCGADGNAALGGRELDGVGEEVVEDLLKAAGVGGDERAGWA